MAKSHCTCTCIKNGKEYCVLCVKNIAKKSEFLSLKYSEIDLYVQNKGEMGM